MAQVVCVYQNYNYSYCIYACVGCFSNLELWLVSGLFCQLFCVSNCQHIFNLCNMHMGPQFLALVRESMTSNPLPKDKWAIFSGYFCHVILHNISYSIWFNLISFGKIQSMSWNKPGMLALEANAVSYYLLWSTPLSPPIPFPQIR